MAGTSRSAQTTGRPARQRPDVAVLIPAAGAGRRMGEGAESAAAGGAPGNKVFLSLHGQPILRRTVEMFRRHRAIARIGVIGRPEEFSQLDALFPVDGPGGNGREKLLPWIEGGAERQQSVRNGLHALQAAPGGPPDWVLVHDGARPFCPPALVERVLDALDGGADGVIPVLPVPDTLCRLRNGRAEPVARNGVHLVQTPQGFRWDALWEAHTAAEDAGRTGTDDAQLLQALDRPIALVPGAPENMKITRPEDLPLAAAIAAGVWQA